MRIGFSGTRKGMSAEQKRQFVLVLSWLYQPHTEFHHGAALGADSEAAAIVIARFACPCVPHPWSDELPPLQRNRVIVSLSDVLIAAPLTNVEEQRSGTWATVRYAREARIPVVMLSR